MIEKNTLQKIITKLEEGGYIGKDGRLTLQPEFQELKELAGEPEPVKAPVKKPVVKKVVKHAK